MTSLANARHVIAGAADNGGNPIVHLRTDRCWTHWLMGGCVALFAGSSLLAQQVQFQGSVPTGAVSPTALSLTLREAIDRGIARTWVCCSADKRAKPHEARLRSLSALLPQVTGSVGENVEQIDLKTRGIDFVLPTFSTPTIVGSVPLCRCARFRLLQRLRLQPPQELSECPGGRARRSTIAQGCSRSGGAVRGQRLSAGNCRFFPGSGPAGAGGNRPGDLPPYR